MLKIISILLSLVLLSSGALASKKFRQPPPPKKYTFDDLKSAADSFRGTFYFINSSRPGNAVASLPANSPNSYPAWVVNARIKAMKARGAVQYLNFPWNDPRIYEGDIVFLKGGDEVSQLIKLFSTWTHTAMVYIKHRGFSFESQKSDGVNTYNYRTAWPKIIAYSVKRVNVPDPMYYINNAVRFYKDRVPYLPSLLTTVLSQRDFFFKWSNKWDTDSMYCAKLIWRTFKDRVNLDSERTSSLMYGNFVSCWTDFNLKNWHGWIGVSPDDIYYSRYVGPDLVYAGLDKLEDPVLDTVF